MSGKMRARCIILVRHKIAPYTNKCVDPWVVGLNRATAFSTGAKLSDAAGNWRLKVTTLFGAA